MATLAPSAGFDSFLRQTIERETLRFTTAGSVDDGKSTLIGRLLYDCQGVYEDQLAAVRQSRINRSTGPIDFSLLTDGLRAERAQGITIDVAYRYFSSPARKFIIADTPGHEQYTRNMVTGASTADLAVVLVDATHGVVQQSRRHAYIAALLGIPHLVVAVNKMDLVDYSQEVFERIQAEFLGFLERLGMFRLGVFDALSIPVSALEGDNVVKRSARMPWYTGPALLEHLESVPVRPRETLGHLRYPVQYVIRPGASFRGFAGQLAGGIVRPGDPVVALPSGLTTRIKSIHLFDQELRQAHPPMSVVLRLEDEMDLDRGDMLVSPGDAPEVARHFEATLVWMHPEPMRPNHPYLAKHTHRLVRANVRKVLDRVDVNTLERSPAGELQMNEIGGVEIEVASPLFFDPYQQNRTTGSFILIDPISNATVAAGMIVRSRSRAALDSLLELITGAGVFP